MNEGGVSARLHVAAAMLSHVGRVRASNEDAVVFVAPTPGSPEAHVGFLALVADGMGGHAAGEVASALAAETVRRVVYASRGEPPAVLRLAFERANEAILAHGAAHPETAGMGTTCTAILIRDGALWLAHVGDSRAYVMRRGQLMQISHDQTLHAQLIREGAMTPQEAKTAPGGNFLLQALGARDEFEPIVGDRSLPLEAGDVVMLCSDGLYAHVSDEEILAILRAHGAAPQHACRALIDKALAGGGTDNISVGVFAALAASPARSVGQAATKPIAIDPEHSF